MSDTFFREILRVGPEATRTQIREAYRKLVMENHPDRFPVEKKALQELAMITLTEAYSALMGLPARALDEPSPNVAQSAGPPPSPPQEPRGGDGSALASLRDRAYSYYKQGFINFSLAIHGIAETNRKLAAGRVPRFTRRLSACVHGNAHISLGQRWRVICAIARHRHQVTV